MKQFAHGVVIAISMLALAVPAFAGDMPGQVAEMPFSSPASMRFSSPAAMPPAGTTPMAVMAADSYLVTTDNEDNAGTQTPDHDMGDTSGGTCFYNTDAVHPLEFNFDVTGALPTTSAELFIRAWDIDETQGEIDEVFLNGTSLGYLTGADSEWSTTLFNVSPALIQPGLNLVQVMVDINNSGSWCASIASGQLDLDGGAATDASCRGVTVDQAAYDFGDSVQVTVEADTALASMNVVVETNLLDPNGINVDGGSQTGTISGTDDDPFTFNLTLPSSGTAGAYQAQSLIFDAGTGQLLASCTTTFHVGSGAPPFLPSVPVPATNALSLALMALLLLLLGSFGYHRMANGQRRK